MENEAEQKMTVMQKTALWQRGISGSTLKLIAIVSMFIDHVGAVIVERMLLQKYPFGLFPRSDFLTVLDNVLRSIGRIAFPIFCFLLVEGFLHTKNVAKYALRLFLFALISEIPFNLAITGKVFYKNYQNVYFTLLIGLLVMILFRMIEEKVTFSIALRLLLYGGALFAGIKLASFLMTDYDGFGVLCIMVLYIFRRNRTYQLLMGCFAFMWEVPAPLAFLPISWYSGNRGLKMKYFFYAFYPLHLLVLYLAAYLMGLV